MSIKPYFFLFFLLFTHCFCPLEASMWDFCRGEFLVGPQFYHMTRTREGGSKQEGVLSGAQVSVQRDRPWGLYWEAGAAYAVGTLRGKAGDGSPTRSTMEDLDLEGRIGYTFCWHYGREFSFTPFLSGGYFRGRNQFQPPSPIEIEVEETYQHVGLGLALDMEFCPGYSLALLWQGRSMIDPESLITNDPFYDDATFVMGVQTHHLVQLWLRYAACCGGWSFDIRFVPFYQYKVYGGQESFPFDYLETQFHIVGTQILLALHF